MKIKANSPATGKDGLDKQNTNKKSEQLDAYRSDATEQALTTNQGVKISDNQNSLKAGVRGATLIEDFILREKLPILTMSEFQNVLCMPVVSAHMAILRLIRVMKN